MSYEFSDLRLHTPRVLSALGLSVVSTLINYYYYAEPVQSLSDAILWFVVFTFAVYIFLSAISTVSSHI